MTVNMSQVLAVTFRMTSPLARGGPAVPSRVYKLPPPSGVGKNAVP
jgi:hypothetical protein